MKLIINNVNNNFRQRGLHEKSLRIIVIDIGKQSTLLRRRTNSFRYSFLYVCLLMNPKKHLRQIKPGCNQLILYHVVSYLAKQSETTKLIFKKFVFFLTLYFLLICLTHVVSQK